MVAPYTHEAKSIWLKIFVVSLFEILLYYQTQRMYMSTECKKEVISQKSLLHMRDRTLKSSYFKNLKD